MLRSVMTTARTTPAETAPPRFGHSGLGRSNSIVFFDRHAGVRLSLRYRSNEFSLHSVRRMPLWLSSIF